MARFTFAVIWSALFVTGAAAWADDISLPKGSAVLAAGQSWKLAFDLKSPQNTALTIAFKDADFTGATILTNVNGAAQLPYHAFGGDTRYDNVKGKAGLHPPVATIAANYTLVTKWTKRGRNSLTITNTGPGQAIVDRISVRPTSALDLPRYNNPIYFDFDVWRQGSPVREGVHRYLDSMLLGILPGGGNYVMNYSGGDALDLKQGAEEARLGWGFGRAHFYSIWHLTNNAREWARYIDVDNNKETSARFHSQFDYSGAAPPGSDIVLIDPERWFAMLKPGIDALLPYSTDYNITCEQGGPQRQGFGEWGDKWAAQGYTAKTWADNYQEAFGKVGDYIHRLNPAAPIFEPHWWEPHIRHLFYDTTLERGKKMSAMTDAQMTHYYTMPFYDFTADGKLTTTDVKPELQYPGGKFAPPAPEHSRVYMGDHVLIPEIAIDWNRYRLGRTEADIKHGDPKINRWGDGRPFRYTAGFDGDEGSYNNETCIYDRNYSAPASYQFLYSMFNYSLLPTAAGEADEFGITRIMPWRPREPQGDDIFKEVQVPINRYGNWVRGAAHTHRLKTEDPLYGGMFGYTGFEQATTGDYIWLGGIKDPQHRREPYNAWNLTRRMCYAFVTAGEVFPVQVNNPDTNHLVVKGLIAKQDWRDVIGLYAVNFDDKPHTLDVTLPVGWTEAVTAQVFDETAADWSDAREVTLAPQRGEIRYRARLPARAPYVIFIYPPAPGAYAALGAAPPPQTLGPWGEQNIKDDNVALRWADAPGATYYVEVAREMLFRPTDIVFQTQTTVPTYSIHGSKLEANHRYHWRVRATRPGAVTSSWSRPRTFWYRAAAPRAVTGNAPVADVAPPRAKTLPPLLPYTDKGNLAHTGQPIAYETFWEGGADAVDGLAASYWVSQDQERKPVLPGWWAVRFDEEKTVASVKILWADKMIGKDFDIQTWDGKAWQTAQTVRGNAAPESAVQLAAPVRTRAVRIYITTPVATDIGIAEVWMG